MRSRKNARSQGTERVGNTLRELGNSFVVDGLRGRQFHRLDLLARCAFDRAQHVPLARRDEQDRFTAATRAAGAADPVHVGFGVVRNVEVDDVADAFDVEAARGDVGRDEDVERS